MITAQQKTQHLFLRAAFGETPDVIAAASSKNISQLVEELFSASRDYKELDYLPYPLDKEEPKNLNGFQVLKMIFKSRQDTQELNRKWMTKMTLTNAALREKMTFFWHNHFATGVPFAYLMQMQNNLLRKNALGKFSDMLHAVAKDPAMILYLNNQQNHKNAPNENFAREVMELFSLGIGHYSEEDIKEPARAFTGWTVNLRGEYEFKEKDHDADEKVFLGKKGNFNGDDIINIILENKQVAVFVTTKIYREFVNDDVNTERVQQLADGFFKSGYDISLLMKNIFSSDWFYDEENIGSKIASPVELLVRYKKLVNLGFVKDRTQIQLQKVLGQTLFFPPNVAGWKGGQHWIDSSSLLLRLNLPKYILNGSGLDIAAKAEPEAQFEETPRQEREHKTTSDWSNLVSAFSNTDKLLEKSLEAFIQCDTGRINKELLLANTDNSTPEKKIISTIANIMSLPEFQLI